MDPMPEDSDWGEVVQSDGSRVPLEAPRFTFPEDEREYLVNRPGLVLWTRRRDEGTDHA